MSLTVSTERTGGGKSDESVRDDARIAIGSDAFSVDVSLVLASLSAIGPFWFFSTVNMAGFTLPGLMSRVASAIVDFAGVTFPPKLICLRNQLPGRGFASGLATIGPMLLDGAGGPTTCDRMLLGGECALLGAGECRGVDRMDMW